MPHDVSSLSETKHQKLLYSANIEREKEANNKMQIQLHGRYFMFYKVVALALKRN